MMHAVGDALLPSSPFVVGICRPVSDMSFEYCPSFGIKKTSTPRDLCQEERREAIKQMLQNSRCDTTVVSVDEHCYDDGVTVSTTSRRW